MATFSHFSVLRFPRNTTGEVLFPGKEHLPRDSDGKIRTAGYVRSEGRKAHALHKENEPPYRDYDVSDQTGKIVDQTGSIRTKVSDLIRILSEDERVVVSARNIMNEFGYQLRLGGKWFRRYLDPEIDPSWPVLAVTRESLQIQPLGMAEDADIITGIPLVGNGVPSGRGFFIAHCSDVAHTYEVHPKSVIGPRDGGTACRELSNTWQKSRDDKLHERDFVAAMEAEAKTHHAQPSRNLLHSVIGQTDDELLVVAVTGALDQIAKMLVDRFRVVDAILLDNGGSVGWLWCQKKAANPIVLVAGPNWRPEEGGTVFLHLGTDFPQPLEHPEF